MDTKQQEGAAGALATATLFALLIAIPAALRASGSSRALVWLALAGSAAILCGTLAASIRTLRGQSHVLKTLGLAFALCLPALAIFGRILKTATHHRALGGVTFAVVGAFVLIGALLVSNRAWRWADDSRGKSLLLMGAGGLGLLAGVRFCLPLVSQPGVRMAALDGVLLLVAAVVASMWVPHSSLQNRTLARGLWAGFGLAALVLVVAVPTIQHSARDAAPVLFGPFWVLSR